MLIPPDVTYTFIRNIVLCIDLIEPPDAIGLETALKFTKQFGCVINVLCVSDHPDSQVLKARAENIRRLLVTQPHTSSIVKGEDISLTLLDFAHTNKADLAIMPPQAQNWIWKLFSEGEIQRMARLTDVPLLAVV